MKISVTLIIAILLGYAFARFFPQPGNLIGLP